MVEYRSHSDAAAENPLRRSRWKLVVAWLLVLAWAGVIFAMSAKSGLELDRGSGIVSLVKAWLASMLSQLTGRDVDPSPIGHFGEYLVFGALLANALRQCVPMGKVAPAALAIAAAYAASDEFHQIFVPGRACDIADWLVDMAAVAIAVGIFAIVARRKASA